MFPADQREQNPPVGPTSVSSRRTERTGPVPAPPPPLPAAAPPVPRREAPECHDPGPEMASLPGSCQAVEPAEENGELDGSLQQMLKAIADERTRLNLRQEVSGLGELLIRGCSELLGPGGKHQNPGAHRAVHTAAIWPQNNRIKVTFFTLTLIF